MDNRLTARFLSIDGTVVIGVSGGPDSLCLLHLALQIPSLKIIVAYFNHQIRPEAVSEAEFVRGVANQMKLPFVTESADVRGYADNFSLSLEEAARTLRYRFLFEQARVNHASAVAVGHTADDQVETVLMHFLRGAGLAGLKGMAGKTFLNEFDRDIPLIRPILHLWRYETESYCRENNLHPVTDASNTDETYFRNRLRHSLIPELEKYNPGIKNTLLRTTEALSGDYEALQDAVDSIWSKVVKESTSNYVAFHASGFEEIPQGLRRNIIRKAMESLRPSMRNLDFNTLERAVNFVSAKAQAHVPRLVPRMVDLTSGLTLFREGEVIYLAALEADLPSAQWPLIESPLELKIGEQIHLNENFSISAYEVEVESVRSYAFENGDPYVALLDANLTGERLTIRTRRRGDVFTPLGMNRQTVKMREFFIKVKLPSRARTRWPLVCSGEQIAWVPGFRMGHPFRITDKTKRVVKLELRRA